MDQNLRRIACVNVRRNVGEHVKAHRTKKEKKEMSQFEKLVTDGNEKADELAKVGAMLDEGYMAEARAPTMQQEREEVYAALQWACTAWWRNGKTVKSSSRSQKKCEFSWKRKGGNETSNGVVC